MRSEYGVTQKKNKTFPKRRGLKNATTESKVPDGQCNLLVHRTTALMILSFIFWHLFHWSISLLVNKTNNKKCLVVFSLMCMFVIFL